MIARTQRLTAQAIVSVFETSQVRGDYSAVTVLPEDAGHLSFGKLQTTLGAGGLAVLLRDYCETPGARFEAKLRPYLPRVLGKDFALDQDLAFRNLLAASADDPVMRDVQDAFFDRAYWAPAQTAADALGLTLPLSVAVVFDGFVQGSFGLIRDMTREAEGEPVAKGEKAWVAAYVLRRRAWLACHSNPALPATAYRMDAFAGLIEQGCWYLNLPLVVRGEEVSEATLHALPPRCYDGPLPGTRSVAVQTPLARGMDVRLAQLALSERGMPVLGDGIFGQASASAVASVQGSHGLTRTGTLDASVFQQLGLLESAMLAPA